MPDRSCTVALITGGILFVGAIFTYVKLGYFREKNNVLQQLSNSLSLPIPEVQQGVEKLLLKAESTNKEIAALKQELHRNLAVTLHKQADVVSSQKIRKYYKTTIIFSSKKKTALAIVTLSGYMLELFYWI